MSTSRLHFMGIGGQGISAVAQMAQAAGGTVTGCDQRASATTDAMQRAGIPVTIGHSPAHLLESDTLVISPAVPALDANNVELLAAQRQGKRIITWQELLGTLMQEKCVLSVSGVHGKGTTTAMLSLMLVDAGLDPTCEIGAVVPRFGANYRLGKSAYFVNEADEFNHNFWHYHPRLVIVTSIEFEHPEFFADYTTFLDAFEHFIRGMDTQRNWPLPPTLILNADSPGCLDLHQRLSDWQGQTLWYSVTAGEEALEGEDPWDAYIRAQEVTKQPWMESDNQPLFVAYDIELEGQTSFRVLGKDGASLTPEKAIQLRLPGIHNIQNSLAAFVAASTLGVTAESIAHTLEGFGGIRRRFEIRHQGTLMLGNKTIDDVTVIDDYAHHPTAIAATIEATRQRYPGHRLIAVYQPHMYSRTKTFFDQFLLSFDDADVVLIATIFPARERDTGLISAQDLVKAIAQRPHFQRGQAQVLYSGGVEETTTALQHTLKEGDIVIVMGAGDIYTVTEQLLRHQASERTSQV